MINIAVFCASSNNLDDAYFLEAQKFGKAIAENGWNLVYGGTDCGMMKAVADAVQDGGGKVYGVMPESIAKRLKPKANIEITMVSNMMERKSKMRELSDAFVALPGGWGTFDEIIEALSMRKVGEHNKPIVFFNINGFFTPLFNYIASLKKLGFVSDAYDNLYLVSDNLKEICTYLRNFNS